MTKKLVTLCATMGAATVLFGAGVANAAPNFDGMTWSDAKSQIEQNGWKGQISARVGDRLTEGDCLVTKATMAAKAAPGFTQGGPSSMVLVSLDCNGTVASVTNPGYSAASPEGRKAVKAAAQKEWFASDEGQAWCAKYEAAHEPYKPCHAGEG